MTDLKKLKEELVNSQIWRSMFRGGLWKNNARDRAQHILGNVWLHLHPVRIRPRALKPSFSWGMGGLSFMLFIVLTLTGVLLMFYYRPAPGFAYRDMKDLEFAITWGPLMRNMHRWSAHAMVLAVILHMVRVFLTGSYKTPREFNWGIGVVLLTLTLFLSFTGYLLPWDQLAIWAVTVGTNMASATPFLGAEGPFSALLGIGMKNDARFALLGGTAVGEATLIRFYVLHCVFVPLVVGVLIMVHFWRIRKDQFSAAPLPGDPPEKHVEVWPHLIVREYVWTIFLMVGLFLWSILQNAPLEQIANPDVTPNPSKAPWYFLGLQELLVYFDPWLAGVVIPNVIIVGLCAIPYLDTSPPQRGVGYYSVRERPFASTVFLVGIVAWFVLIIIGTSMRGPNWAWYWPWEDWTTHKPPPPPTTIWPAWIGGPLLAAYFGLGLFLPRLIKGEIPFKKAAWGGLVLLLLLGAGAGLMIGKVGVGGGITIALFLYLYLLLGFLMPQKYLKQLDQTRYVVTMALLLMMLGVFLKMGVRLGFNVKYVLSFPQVNFNI